MTVRIDQAVPGHYKVRMVRGGPWVPTLIYIACPIEFDVEPWNWLDRAWHLCARRGDQDVPVDWVWPHCADYPIDQAEYLYLLDLGRWAVVHAPDDPIARPTTAPDITKMAPIF